MTEEQAFALAENIQQQFPHVETQVLQAGDLHAAPGNWFVSVKRRDAQVDIALHIHNSQEWIEAVEAYQVLRS